MMSWDRPENINRILSTYQEYLSVDEIIVWNNNPHYYVSNLNLSKVKTLNSSTDFGLNTRFIGCLLAKNRCVIVHDDDLILSETNLKNLIQHFEKDYTRIYTYEGRIPQNGEYTCSIGPGRLENVKEPIEADIALTRVTCFDKLYAAEYCKLSDVIFYDVNTNLNGEDIVMSYLVGHLSGKKPLVLPIPDIEGYRELPAPIDTKISTKPNFIGRRTNLVNRCELLLPTPKYPDPQNKNRTIFFGNGYYPYGYYKDSFIVNSDYKKLLIKDDLNGIKYLSCHTTNKYDWTIFYLNTNIHVSSNDELVLKGFLKDSKMILDIELNFIDKDIETNTSRIRATIGSDYVSCIKLKIGDYYSCTQDTLLNSVKFIIYTKNQPPSELCITELGIYHDNQQ